VNVDDQQPAAAVEEIIGRKVRGLVSGMDTHRDVASEVFYLQSVEA
jgi:uncharacterized protein YbcI